MLQSDLARAEAHLDEFLRRTGVRGGAGDPSRRYLWNDAHAVQTLISVARRRGTREPIEDAVRLADLVHRTLGRHRKDDPRIGWISGLDELAGEQHPTKGGLRIGKPLRERAIGEPFDEFLEWERDGQYFHYLTRWMEALCALSGATGEHAWCRMSIELATRTCAAFTYFPSVGTPPRMYWKMSIDLSRPLVTSMGHHDPLDGLAAAWRVQATRHDFGAEGGELAELVGDYRLLCEEAGAWSTQDALGIGGLLSALAEFTDLVATGRMPFDPLIVRLARDADRSLAHWSDPRELEAPRESRLAFREIGLAIGLRAIPAMCEAVESHPARFGGSADRAILRAHLEDIAQHLDLAGRIEAAWLAPSAEAAPSWLMHEDINSVMLAASLLGGSDAPHARRLLRRLSAGL